MSIPRKDIDALKAKKLYASGLTSTEVGRILGVSHNIVLRSLREANVFIRPRHWKGGTIVSGGYAYVKRSGHPLANSRGYVMRAVLVWEEASGQPFPEGMFPHHDNEIALDDRPENIMPVTRVEHSRIHMKRRHEHARQVRQGDTVKDNGINQERRYKDGAGSKTCP
jgi:hypothetical protein